MTPHPGSNQPDPALNQLAGLLRRRLAIIADHQWRERDSSAHLAALRQVSSDIDQWTAQHGSGLPSRLAHFLERRSYDKALAFLELGDNPLEHHTHEH